MRRFFIAAAAVCLCAAATSAQTKVSRTAQFGKPDPSHMVPVGDRPDHNMGVEQLKCTWTKPMEIGGDKAKEGVSTETVDVSGNTGRARGVHVTTMESGDKYFVSYQGTATYKYGAPAELKGTWGFNGGAERHKGQRHVHLRAGRRRAVVRDRRRLPAVLRQNSSLLRNQQLIPDL